MIYVVVPEAVTTADEFTLWSTQHDVLQGFATNEDAVECARGLAKRLGQAFTVRKVSMVSYHPGKP